MNLLLDTHGFLWSLFAPDKLSKAAYFFSAITSSEGSQRTLPPEIKSVNFSTLLQLLSEQNA